MKAKLEEEECGNKVLHSNGNNYSNNVVTKDHVMKKRNYKDDEAHHVMMIKYKECRKNHAAKIGKYAVDGCCEFMAAGEEGTDGALRCAACDCHRNFHRREITTNIHSNSSSSNSV